MGILKKAVNIPNVDFVEYKHTKYYRKYQYRAEMNLPGAQLAYLNDIDAIEAEAEERACFARENAYRWLSNSESLLEDVRENKNHLIKYLDWVAKNRELKIITTKVNRYVDSAFIYCDDLQELLTLNDILPVKVVITQVELEQSIDVMYFVEKPPHNYRIYMNSKFVMEENIYEKLSETFSKSVDLFPSPSLLHWVKHYSHTFYSNPYHFIDYDHESTVSFLMLRYGSLFGKRYKLEKRSTPI
jgi:hypothetical protein